MNGTPVTTLTEHKLIDGKLILTFRRVTDSGASYACYPPLPVPPLVEIWREIYAAELDGNGEPYIALEDKQEAEYHPAAQTIIPEIIEWPDL